MLGHQNLIQSNTEKSKKSKKKKSKKSICRLTYFGGLVFHRVQPFIETESDWIETLQEYFVITELRMERGIAKAQERAVS